MRVINTLSRAIRNNIQQIPNSINREYLLYIFLLGIIIGTFFVNLLPDDYYTRLSIDEEYYVTRLQSVNIAGSSLFFFILGRRIKEILLLALLNCTFLAKISNTIYFVLLGIGTSVSVGINVMKYGFGGILIYFLSVFPYCIIFIIILYYLIKKAENIRKRLYSSDKMGDIVPKVLLYLSILILFTIIEAVIETFVNGKILISILK